ncbi:MAG TPA: M1 family aminopeptidase [Anaeromyxobacteraceae bacterium]|nr:M1 family aminopeptidase [Anaeromyxobacteraceae bacterium]
MPHPTEDRNYRLPLHVRPLRYVATLSLDLAGRAFRGRETVQLTVSRPTDEIVLHGANLDVSRAAVRASGRSLAAEAKAIPASETLRLRLPEPVQPGAVELEVEWSGKFTEGLRGLYQAGPLAVTQFEAADARRLFPCFDEPGFKASWSLTLEAPKGAVVLSNSRPASGDDLGDRVRVAFSETPPLASYLVALAAGTLEATPPETVRGVPVRTWAVPGKVHLAAFGQEVAAAVLPRLEDYFGIPYAFGKLDQLAVPDFEAGAMENAGLVTYREVMLLLDPANAPLTQKKRVSEVVTHELSHMWFGNWVTMAWWDDLWLNEAFATWMAFKTVDGWRPQWRVWLEFDAGKAAAMGLDALRSTHPIRAEVHNAAEATEAFDLITYEKGGAVLRMIEGWLGEEPFRDGIRLYMKSHARGNATADDLWAALSEASRQPVVELANAWIGKGGFPLLRVERQGRRLALSQRRFFSEPGAREEGRPSTWPVPAVLRWQDQGGLRERRVLLRNASDTVELEAQGEVAWLCANAGATGFYRVAYDVAGLAALTRHLGALRPEERIQLLADEWALVRAGERPVGAFLDLAAGFGGEEDYAVLDELGARLSVLEHRLLDDAQRPRFRAFLESLLGRQLSALGWEAAPDEADGQRLRRRSLVWILGLVGRSPEVAAEGSRRMDWVLAGETAALEANLHDPVATMAARAGDEGRFERFLSRYRGEADPAFKRRYLMALAAFETPPLASRGRKLAFGETVPLQDLASYAAALLANRATRDAFWVELRQRWPEVMARTAGAPMLQRRLVEAMGGLTERRHLEEARAFLKAHPVEPARQAAAQTLERLDQDVALRERCLPEVSRWLESRA